MLLVPNSPAVGVEEEVPGRVRNRRTCGDRVDRRRSRKWEVSKVQAGVVAKNPVVRIVLRIRRGRHKHKTKHKKRDPSLKHLGLLYPRRARTPDFPTRMTSGITSL